MDDERRHEIAARLKEMSEVFEALAVEAVALAVEIDAMGDGDDVIEISVAHWNDGTLARN